MYIYINTYIFIYTHIYIYIYIYIYTSLKINLFPKICFNFFGRGGCFFYKTASTLVQ